MRIAYAEVQVGDQIYNSLAYHPSAAWHTVVSITRDKDYVSIKTASYTDTGHAREGISVRRPGTP